MVGGMTQDEQSGAFRILQSMIRALSDDHEPTTGRLDR